MKILLLRGVCGFGGAENRYLRMQRQFMDRGLDASLFWFEAGNLIDQIPPDQPSTVGSLADAVKLVADGGYDVVQCVTDDFDVGAQALFGLGGARLFGNVAGQTSSRWPRGRCTALIAVSRWLQQAQARRTDAPVELVYNGVDTERFCPGEVREPPPRPVVAWIGRASSLETKRIDRLAAAAPGLASQGFAIWLISPLGKNELPAELETSLREQVERWESLGTEAMPELYRAVAASGGCVLNTSAREGLSNVLLEAQACGCPVVASAVGGNAECVVPEHGGTLFPPDLPGPALAELVGGVLRDPRGVAWRGEAARRMVLERFSLEAMIDGYLRVYQTASWPRRWDGAALTYRAKQWWQTRRRNSPTHRALHRVGRLCLDAAAELEAEGRGDLATHVRERARNLAPWLRS